MQYICSIYVSYIQRGQPFESLVLFTLIHIPSSSRRGEALFSGELDAGPRTDVLALWCSLTRFFPHFVMFLGLKIKTEGIENAFASETMTFAILFGWFLISAFTPAICLFKCEAEKSKKFPTICLQYPSPV